MTYVPEESKVIYRSKDDKKEKDFDVLEWIAAMPAKGEQMVRYYGFYSPALRGMARGKRKNQDQDDLIPSILEPVEDPDFSGDGSSSEYRKNWARLIQKIYEVDPLTCPNEVDPLTCPKCSGKMKIISVIEDEDVIKKILKHLGLWDQKVYPPSVWRARPVCVHRTNESRISYRLYGSSTPRV